MKPARFDYHAPREYSEVLSLLDHYGEDARPLAGGQSLVPLLNMRIIQPAALIDLARCPELSNSVETSDCIEIRAMLRQTDALAHRTIVDDVPLLAAALHYVGGPTSRNRGTVCGSLAHADPLAELPSVALALDAQFCIEGKNGKRTVLASEFFVSALSTAVNPGELLAAVRFPRQKNAVHSAFVEVGIRKHGFVLVGIALQFSLDGEGKCSDVRIAAMGASDRPVRLNKAEGVAQNLVLDEKAILNVSDAAFEEVDPPSDSHADGRYRRHLVRVLTRRAFYQAVSSTR